MRRISIVIAMAALCACESKAPAPSEAAAKTSAAEYHPVADMKELMNWVLEPYSDVIWEAVGSVTDEHGTKELAPQTDEEWTNIRNAAAVVAESGNLLLMPGRARDEGDWVKHSHDLTKAAQAVLLAAEAKDTASLFTAGGDMYLVCTACHEQYALDLKKVN